MNKAWETRYKREIEEGRAQIRKMRAQGEAYAKRMGYDVIDTFRNSEFDEDKLYDGVMPFWGLKEKAAWYREHKNKMGEVYRGIKIQNPFTGEVKTAQDLYLNTKPGKKLKAPNYNANQTIAGYHDYDFDGPDIVLIGGEFDADDYRDASEVIREIISVIHYIDSETLNLIGFHIKGSKGEDIYSHHYWPKVTRYVKRECSRYLRDHSDSATDLIAAYQNVKYVLEAFPSGQQLYDFSQGNYGCEEFLNRFSQVFGSDDGVLMALVHESIRDLSGTMSVEG